MNGKESIFKAFFRCFFITLAVFLGITVGVLLMTAGLVGVTDIEETKPDKSYTIHTLPDEKGVRKKVSSSKPAILQVNIEGVIGLEKLTTDDVEKLLVESREGDLKDDLVKAVLLNINSPGGTVVDSDGIFRAILEYKQLYDVPVYAYVDGMCASGGVYIAMAADKIYATDVSVIGSVGVLISSFMNFSDLLDKVGVKTLSLSAGKGKDALNPLRPWKAGEGDNIKSIVDYYYNYFVNIVTAHRPITREALVNEYGAHVFPAEIAREHGYIDALAANRKEVVHQLAKAAGLEEDNYQVVSLHPKKWLSELLSNKNALLKGEITHKIELADDLNPMLLNKFLYLYRPGE